MDAALKAIEQFGISCVVIAFFIAGTGYVLRRLFNATNGILTKVGERHIEYLSTSERCLEQLARSNDAIAEKSERQAGEIGRIADQQDQETVKMNRAGVHACDVLEKVADSLGIKDATGSSIDSIRRELTTGRANQ